MYACGADVETTEHFLLRCHFYSTKDLNSLIIQITPILSDKDHVSFMLYGSKKPENPEICNQSITQIVIKHLKKIGHFDNSLL